MNAAGGTPSGRPVSKAAWRVKVAGAVQGRPVGLIRRRNQAAARSRPKAQ